ncbi:hypothetical protein ACSLBF_20330 (plasmid) [Pseudoalteromonas sp. T1lg65]|uniref:hypothetical protein n=1 Tax=Pseudoalteromonas sp. T1lg65 TaxID=2077101 RepID=UPI003F7A4AAE
MKLLSKIALGSTAALGSAMASATATTPDVAATIETAVAAGQSNYTLVVVGLLSLASIGFGVGFIISKLSR